jgi:hypothetical protein
MSTSIEIFDKQQNKMENLLKPLLTADIEDDDNDLSMFRNAIMDITYAMKNMIIVANYKAKKVLKVDIINSNTSICLNKDIETLCKDFIQKSQYTLSLYSKYGSLYSLFTISTITFVHRFPKFNVTDNKDFNNNDNNINNEELRDFYNTVKHLDVLKNICIKVYVRDTLTSLAIEMLVFTIPIIIFDAILSSNSVVSFHSELSSNSSKILYAIGISVIIFPFGLLLVRSVPILYLMRSSSALPFSHIFN